MHIVVSTAQVDHWLLLFTRWECCLAAQLKNHWAGYVERSHPRTHVNINSTSCVGVLLLSGALCSPSTADGAPFVFMRAPLRRATFSSERDSETGVQYVVFWLWRLKSYVLPLAILSNPALILRMMWETEPDHLCCQSWRGVKQGVLGHVV